MSIVLLIFGVVLVLLMAYGYIDALMVSYNDGDSGILYCNVSSISLNGNSFTLDTDEDPKYSAEDLNVYEMIDVYNTVNEIDQNPEWTE